MTMDANCVNNFNMNTCSIYYTCGLNEPHTYKNRIIINGMIDLQMNIKCLSKYVFYLNIIINYLSTDYEKNYRVDGSLIFTTNFKFIWHIITIFPKT